MSGYTEFNRTVKFEIVQIVDLLIYTSIYLSLAGVAMGYISCMLHGIPFNWQVFAVMFLVTYSVYNIDRKADEEEDSINHSQRYAFTKRYEKFLFSSSVVAYVIALGISASFGLGAVLVASIPLVSGLMYSFTWLPKSFKYRRLKEVPSGKNLVIALAWALTPSLLPVQFYGSHVDMLSLVTILYFFTLVFINSAVFDMRDIEGDSISGVITIPVLLGAQRTKYLLWFMNMLAGVVVLKISFVHIPLSGVCILAAGFIYAHCYIYLFDRDKWTNTLCDVMADGQFIMLGLGLCILTTIFESFGM
ncbi:MAG: UbiA family prenyltransferase [Euryarchaeota archaeon]|nr:UbiA family prenyltransferase [Euryarchaeota archaeon]